MVLMFLLNLDFNPSHRLSNLPLANLGKKVYIWGMGRDSETSFTPEQTALLGIEQPRKPWSERAFDRVMATLIEGAKGGITGVIAGYVASRLLVEGMYYLSNILSPGSMEEFIDFGRNFMPTYVGVATGIGTGGTIGLIEAMGGEKFFGPQSPMRKS